MGRDITFTYRVEVKESTGNAVVTPMGWRKEYGKPTQDNLTKWVESYNNALKPDGVNAHVSKALGHMPILSHAKIVRQSTGDTICEWNAPVFMVV